MAKTAPGPRGNLILGNARDFQQDIMTALMKGWREYGDVVQYRGIGPLFPVFCLAHPDYTKHVLQDNNKNYPKTKFVDDKWRMVVGEGLICSTGDFWKRQRRLAQPAFHRQKIAAFGKLMTDATEELLEEWQAPAEQGRALDMKPQMVHLTLAILASALFSADWSREAKAMGPAVGIAIRHAYEQMEQFVSLPQNLPTPANRRFKAARATLDEIVYRLIAERRRTKADSGDLLSMLMLAVDVDETGESMNDQQVHDEVMTFIFGGHETVSSGLTWTFYLLSKHPVVARRLRQELSRVLGGRTPTVGDIPQLPYLTMVIEEAMRLYPPVWLISRTPTEDDEIGGYHIPAGSMVLVSKYVVHRHPAFWENPDGFDPERFTPERVAARPRHAYFPFSAGPRKCIGDGFGVMEMQLVLATILQRYQLDLVPGFPVIPQPGITLRQKYGLWMTLRPIQSADAARPTTVDSPAQTTVATGVPVAASPSVN
jgi:cytochrome P450